MADTAGFQIVYSGSALDSNEMDVRELAPALLAFADAIEEANRVINGDRASVRLNVSGSFKSGSFGIDLTVILDAIRDLLTALNSDPANGAKNLLDLIGIGGTGGLIGVLRWLRNRKATKIEVQDDKRVIFEIESKETIEASPEVLKLYRNTIVRSSLEKAFFEPLSKDGIDSIRMRRGGAEVIIPKAERDSFVAPPLEDEPLSEFVTEAHLQIASLSFVEANKWRFTRGAGDSAFFADIDDEGFVERVNRNEITFAKGDILKVRLRTRETLTERGLKSEYRIERVLEHRSAARQLPLPSVAQGECPPDRPIKGNIGSSGKVYHVPGSANYAATVAEECFATDVDAEAAGYRKAQR